MAKKIENQETEVIETTEGRPENTVSPETTESQPETASLKLGEYKMTANLGEVNITVESLIKRDAIISAKVLKMAGYGVSVSRVVTRTVKF